MDTEDTSYDTKCGVDECENTLKDDYHFAELIGDYICSECFEEDLQYPINLFRIASGKSEKVLIGDCVVMDEHGDVPSKWFWDLFDNLSIRKWVSTDAWRGFAELQIVNAHKAASGWTTGWIDESVNRKELFNQWFEDVLQGGVSYDFPLYVVVSPTSNIFSISIDVFTDNEDNSKVLLEDVDLGRSLS